MMKFESKEVFSGDLDGELRRVMKSLKAEPVPARLLALARELEAALDAQANAFAAQDAEHRV